jgi:hypothetical protein
VYFNHYPDGQIWKIKSNGDSLTQVTHDPSEKESFFINNQCTKMVIGRVTTDYQLVITDMNGNVYDTINARASGIWAPNSQKIILIGPITPGDTGLASYDVQSKVITSILMFQNSSVAGVQGLCWLSDSKNIILCSQNWLSRMNIESGEITHLKNACSGKTYSGLSLSPNGNNFICDRTDIKIINFAANQASEARNIWSINTDGWSEHEIVIK